MQPSHIFARLHVHEGWQTTWTLDIIPHALPMTLSTGAFGGASGALKYSMVTSQQEVPLLLRLAQQPRPPSALPPPPALAAQLWRLPAHTHTQWAHPASSA